MTKTEYREYLSSAAWLETRKLFLSMSPECHHCRLPRWLASIAYDQDLHVHHLSYVSIGNEDFDHLEALCRRCHEMETFGRSSLIAPWSSQCVICTKPCFDRFQRLEFPAGYLCSDCVGVLRAASDEHYHSLPWGSDGDLKMFILSWFELKASRQAETAMEEMMF